MNVDVLLGLQWGDEGKGKIVDVMTPTTTLLQDFKEVQTQVTLLNLKVSSTYYIQSHLAYSILKL